MPTIRAGELGEPTRIIEVDPLVSPVPQPFPETVPAELEPEPVEVEARR